MTLSFSDTQEYKAYLEQLKIKGAVNTNPLYKPPITTTMNPTFEGLTQRNSQSYRSWTDFIHINLFSNQMQQQIINTYTF